jgi:hypothetical protein
MKGWLMHRKLFRGAAVAAAIAALAAAGLVGQAKASTARPTSPSTTARPAMRGSAPGQFTIGPAPAPDGAPRGYFIMAIAPGGSDHDVIDFSNGSSTTQKISVGTTNGLTATDSGSAFGDLAGACSGIGCWITGLPTTITLAPDTTEEVGFLVKVPADAKPMQYLGGITARPTTAPRPAATKAAGRTSTHVIIVAQVTIGVAITVGRLASLRTRLDMTGVTATWIDSLVRLSVDVRNRGQRFTKGTGNVSCTLNGTTRSYPLDMDTVLPGDGAALPVNGLGMHTGVWLCTVKIKDSGGRTDTWTGDVTVPSTVAAATKRIAPNDYVVPSEPGIPGWAIALMVLAGLILFSIWALILRRSHDRNRGKHADT